MRKILGLFLAIAVLSGSLIGCASAEFEAGAIDTPEYVLTGAPVTVNLEVTNTGSAEGTYPASLKLNGTEVDSGEITIPAGASKEISFTFDIDEAGTYTVDINGVTAEVTALAPEEIITRVREASGDIKTIQANMIMSVSMEMSKEGEKQEMDISMDSDFTIDNENRKMALSMYMTAKIPGAGSIEGTVDTYLVNDTLYAKTDMAGTDSGWEKTELTAEDWNDYQPVETQLDIAEYAEIEFLRTETLDGENCLVYKIIPDKEDVIDAIMSHQQMNQPLADESGDFTSVFTGLFGQMLEFDVEMWISEGKFLIKKTVIAGDIDLTILAGFKMAMEMELRDIKYDEPVKIQLPPELQVYD